MIPLYLLSLLISSTTVHAVIITVDFVKNTMPELKAKKFVLFGDQHEHSDEDIPQLDALAKTLTRRDQESQQTMHILIEQPAGTPFYYSVQGHLRERLQGCIHTTVENIEMRCAAGGAWTLLSPDNKPNPIWAEISYNSAYATCRLGDLTIGEVDHEISYYKQAIDEWLATLPPLYARAIRIWEPEFQDLMGEYRSICTILSVTPSTNIKELSDRLYQQDPQSRQALYKVIHDLASVLFDMHICKCMMALKHPDIIALVAGARHTSRVYGLLDRIGNKTIARYGTSCDSGLRHLSEKYLVVDPGCCSCCFSCPIL